VNRVRIDQEVDFVEEGPPVSVAGPIGIAETPVESCNIGDAKDLLLANAKSKVRVGRIAIGVIEPMNENEAFAPRQRIRQSSQLGRNEKLASLRLARR